MRGKAGSRGAQGDPALVRLRRRDPGRAQGHAHGFHHAALRRTRFIKETERAIRQLGLKGILIHSSHKGHYPDDDEARPFWELVQDLDVPVFIHPPHVGFGEERVKDYRLASSVGRPADLCLALSRLIVRGLSGGFSARTIVLRTAAADLGSDRPAELRLRAQEECYFLGPYTPIKIKHEPGYYRRRMYFDTVTFVRRRRRWSSIAPAPIMCIQLRRAPAHLAQAAGDQAGRRPARHGTTSARRFSGATRQGC